MIRGRLDNAVHGAVCGALTFAHVGDWIGAAAGGALGFWAGWKSWRTHR